jgi:hypothetical protein
LLALVKNCLTGVQPKVSTLAVQRPSVLPLGSDWLPPSSSASVCTETVTRPWKLPELFISHRPTRARRTSAPAGTSKRAPTF